MKFVCLKIIFKGYRTFRIDDFFSEENINFKKMVENHKHLW